MKTRAYGNLIGITMDMSADEFRKVQKYAPEALLLQDEEGNDKYKIMLSDGECDCGLFIKKSFGSVNEFGTEFIDVCGKPHVWMGIPNSGLDDRKEFIRENYGLILADLNQIEKQIKDALRDVDRKIAEIDDGIEEVEF